ncbi:ATP-binding protein [Actinomadura monticuli]|uniref:ATP-binding protein n=1 Tax=Actinomadura monticuli TaxID=3097367 RepID=A0ABV4QCW5_9ACTN
MVPAIRAFVRGLLDGSPRTSDAELVVSELAANSLRHTISGAPGGEVSVTVALRPGWVRIAVTDAGAGAWQQPAGAVDAVSEYGRGLFIVEQTADKVGHDITKSGQTMWAEFTWDVES